MEYDKYTFESSSSTTKSRHPYRLYTMFNDNGFTQSELHPKYGKYNQRRTLCIYAVLTGFFVVCTSVMLFVFGGMDEKLLSVSDMKLPHHVSRRSAPNNSYYSPHNEPAGDFLKEDRVAEHCHLPDIPALGMEGFYEKEKYTLEQVHVILSSGETTPHQLHPDLPVADCRYNSYTTGTLQDFPNIVNSYIRANKAQTKFNKYTISNEQKCPPGQLSPLGMTKIHQHGRYIRDIYSESLKSRLDIHHSSKWLKVVSGEDPSSFHSTLSYLSGFLPQKHLHRVHIEKVTNHLCDWSKSDCHCPRMDRSASFSMDNVATLIQNQKLGNKDKSFKRFIKSFLGRNLSAVQAFSQLSPLICDKVLAPIGCHGNHCWNVSRLHVVKLFQAIDKHLEDWMTNRPNIEQSRLHMYPFLTSLLKSFKQAHIRTSPRLFIYTSNEEFMLQLLTAIENKLGKFPRPGSRLVFELLSTTKQEKKQYFLRVLFNGRDVTNDIPLCSRRNADRICPLKYFVDFHSLNFRNMFSLSSYTERCL
ncbi:2-phosphoxylose phosphatase 1-like isoform X2 [Argopecten irradians]|uniref:2-phosphoxylose phosphatase 1-like isoform X2 n=1 Tax=Argopecten irradians TaxID=31199 RepID=UPI00371123A7